MASHAASEAKLHLLQLASQFGLAYVTAGKVETTAANLVLFSVKIPRAQLGESIFLVKFMVT